MSVSGRALNDCHAEVIARRCLCEYLFKQLEYHTENREAESVLEPARKGFKLKPGIQFHLYINTAPCGDARIFSPHEDSDSVDKHPNRRARGQLRTKIESGEGTIPVKSSEGIQTWDGVLMVGPFSLLCLIFLLLHSFNSHTLLMSQKMSSMIHTLLLSVIVYQNFYTQCTSMEFIKRIFCSTTGSKATYNVMFRQNSSVECARNPRCTS